MKSRLRKLLPIDSTSDNRIVRRINNSYGNNRYKGFYKGLGSDIRMPLLIAPIYGDDNSYSGYVNQNPNNEMYQYMMLNKPRHEVHTSDDVIDKYMQDDGFTFK